MTSLVDPTHVSAAPGGGTPTSFTSQPLPGPPPTQGNVDQTADIRTQLQTKLTDVTGFTFTAKTCLELLPGLTSSQLDFEFNYRSTVLGQTFDNIKTRKPNKQVKSAALNQSLSNVLTQDISYFVHDCNIYQSLICDLSCAVDKAKAHIEDLLSLQQHTTTPASTTDSEVPDISLPEPVCFLNFIVDSYDIDDVCKDVVFERVGSRKVAHFGPVKYSYGRISHPARPYPESSEHAINKIFEQVAHGIDNPDFSRENYSCLVTLYENDKARIPYHSDNETSILPNSSIYTVSLGEDRTINYRNIIGPVQQKSYNLPNGSIHVMSRQSQDFWEHSIPPSSEPCGPRVSLTFRRLVDRQANSPQEVPPIHTPVRSSTSPPTAKQTELKRVLILTDSIISTFPTDIFPDNLCCIKKLNFKLCDIDKYESEFMYTDYVIISCGVNDLSRFDHTADSLIHETRHKLKYFCNKYPKTNFIFNSLLHTKIDWLNREIDIFNAATFQLSLDVRHESDNFWFFDSHHIAQCGHERREYRVLDPRHSVHITENAKRDISFVLRTCIVFISTRDRRTSTHWPLRAHFRRMLF